MEYQILLNKNENTRQVEEQEQARFIKSILEALELPIEFDPDKEPSIEDRQRIRQEFKDFNLHILKDNDGGIKVIAADEIVGEWYKPTYKLKKDLSQIDPRDQLYLEMNCKYASILFEPTTDEGSEMQA